MSMRYFYFLIPAFISAIGYTQAEPVDEQLLYAQNAYQQAFSQQTKARSRFDDAQSTLQGAQSRLSEAQKAVQKAETDLSTAQAAKATADGAMEQATTNLRAAWQRKQGGGS